MSPNQENQNFVRLLKGMYHSWSGLYLYNYTSPVHLEQCLYGNISRAMSYVDQFIEVEKASNSTNVPLIVSGLTQHLFGVVKYLPEYFNLTEPCKWWFDGFYYDLMWYAADLSNRGVGNLTEEISKNLNFTQDTV